MTPYVPWAPGLTNNASGVSFGAGTDLGQQTPKTWSIIAGGDQGLYNKFSGALGSGVRQQNAIDWLTDNPNLLIRGCDAG